MKIEKKGNWLWSDVTLEWINMALVNKVKSKTHRPGGWKVITDAGDILVIVDTAKEADAYIKKLLG